jgi:hypothetical protein
VSRLLSPRASEKAKLEKRRRIFCATYGHSRLRDFFFGYHYCARCGDTLGDSLGGAYVDFTSVLIHHMYLWTQKHERPQSCNCPENAEKLKRKDFTLVPKYNSLGYAMRPPWTMKPGTKEE